MQKQNTPRETKRVTIDRGYFALPVSLPIPSEILCTFIIYLLYMCMYTCTVCVQPNKILYHVAVSLQYKTRTNIMICNGIQYNNII